MAELHLTHADNNSVIDVTVGDTVTITLPENATTGYQWTVSAVTGDCVALAATERRAGSSGALGAGHSARVFRFEANTPGHASVTLKLSRGGARDGPVVTFNTTVQVSPR
jgi:inhibitor of cysteine peptidase